MNVSDSERIATILEKQGYCPNDEKDADLIIVNACSVRQKAVDRIWGGIKKWQAAQKEIILTGCVLPADRQKFAQKGIRFFSIEDLLNLKNISQKRSDILQNVGTSNKDYFKILPIRQGDIAYVPIMTGCDNFCSYCAVPYTRGREKSRPLSNIISDIKRAFKNGSKNILLLGQNVNSYQYGFAKLLKTIDNLPGDFKFNFISSNPHDMTDDLVKTLVQLKKWPHELHLPLQSGDDNILKKMNRKYTAKRYLKLVTSLKSPVPDIKLTTDIIVGFPGETKKQFENTVKICKKIKFAKAYIAQYSPRPGTAAAKLKDDVPAVEKKRRWQVLEKLINS